MTETIFEQFGGTYTKQVLFLVKYENIWGIFVVLRILSVCISQKSCFISIEKKFIKKGLSIR